MPETCSEMNYSDKVACTTCSQSLDTRGGIGMKHTELFVHTTIGCLPDTNNLNNLCVRPKLNGMYIAVVSQFCQ
eukprot:7332956-Ditylum_brightwellii.AAC.1